MIAVVGLGNPGADYLNTRHNAGFKVIDILGDKLNANYWKNECGATVAHCKCPQNNSNANDLEVLLIKPMSYMNLSGGPVKNICNKYNIFMDDLFIVHDDMDIKSGCIRVKRGGSSAGHNGLKSITNKLNSSDYLRVRVGIGRPNNNRPFDSYVLERPKGKLAFEFEESCLKASEAVIYLFNHSLAQAQQKFN